MPGGGGVDRLDARTKSENLTMYGLNRPIFN